MSIIVAIDGPSGVGKTTTSKLVARELNLPHIDTGAMYRAVTCAVLDADVATNDAEACASIARKVAITLEGDWVQKGGGDTRLDYIEFPLTVGAVAVTGGGAMRARIYSGISFGFKVSCSSDLDVCEDASGTEWGWPFGLQVAKVNENNSFIGLDVKYTVALSDAFDVIDAYTRPWQFRLMFGKLLGTSAGY